MFNRKIKCSSCGAELPAESRFCSKCGRAVEEKINASCPKCGAVISAGASFCGKCGSSLTQSPKTEATVSTSKEFDKNRRWMRNPGDFAQRFEISDLKGFFAKQVTVEQGTNAIFLQGGVYKGTLPAGVYTLDNLLKRIFRIKLEERATIILVDAGDVPLTFAFSDKELRAKNSFNVSASGRLTAKITNAVSFLENFLKGGDHVSLTDIENYIHDELLNKAQYTISKYSPEELYGNAEVSQKLEIEFISTLNFSLNSKGLEITQLNCIGFDEGAYKEVLKIRTETQIEVGKARALYEGKSVIRNLDNSDKVDEIEGDTAVAKTAQKGSHELEEAEVDHKIGIEKKIHASQMDEDRKELEMLLDIKRRQREDKRADERQHIENLDSASIETLIYMADDSKAGKLAKLELAKRGVSLTPEQILAIQAGDSDAAAEALGKKFSADEQKEFNKRTEELYRENADRNERILEKALDAMGQTAAARATAQNPGATVVSGGMGSPVIVGSAQQGSVKKCSKCGASVSSEDVFCPECGERV